MIRELGIQDGMEKVAIFLSDAHAAAVLGGSTVLGAIGGATAAGEGRRGVGALAGAVPGLYGAMFGGSIGSGNATWVTGAAGALAAGSATGALIRSAGGSKRRRGPWRRRLMQQGAASGRLPKPGSFGQAGTGTRPLEHSSGSRSSKTAAIDPMKMQRALEVATQAVRAMGPAMLTGALTGAVVARTRADRDKGGAMARGALAGAALGGVIGTGAAMGESRRIFQAAGGDPQLAAQKIRSLQQLVGAGGGAVGGLLPKSED